MTFISYWHKLRSFKFPLGVESNSVIDLVSDDHEFQIPIRGRKSYRQCSVKGGFGFKFPLGVEREQS